MHFRFKREKSTDASTDTLKNGSTANEKSVENLEDEWSRLRSLFFFFFARVVRRLKRVKTDNNITITKSLSLSLCKCVYYNNRPNAEWHLLFKIFTASLKMTSGFLAPTDSMVKM